MWKVGPEGGVRGLQGAGPRRMLFQGALDAEGKERLAGSRCRSGGPASARGCHGNGRVGDGGCAEKRSAFSLAAAPGPRRRWVRLCLPRGGPGHGVLWPEPLGLGAGLGAARRRPALTAVRCSAPGGAEAECGRPNAFRMLIKEYHILLPMSLDEYQVAQLYMIQVRAVGSGDQWGPTA